MSALLFKPGKLTSEYFAGRRKLFMAPLALFFFINLVYFLYQPVDALNSSLASQVSGQSYSNWSREVVSQRLQNTPMDLKEFTIAYNQMSAQVSKLFLVVFVLFFAVGTALVNVRKKSLFYFHLITATHYVSFAILSILIILPFLASVIFRIFSYFTQSTFQSFDPNAWYISVPMFLLLGGYAFAMQRRLYIENILILLLKALLLVVAFALSVVMYRLFLFVVVMVLI